MSYSSRYDAETGEWNDSLRGEFLWSSVNTREAIPDVMTPSTWSLWQIYYIDSNPIKLPERYPFCGNICGRPYLNLSLVVSMYRAVGKDIRSEMHGDIIGSVQSDLEIPIIPFSPVTVVWMVLPGMIKARRYASNDGSKLSKFILSTPAWCRDTGAHIQEQGEKEPLQRLWKETIKPYFSHACNLLRSVTMQFTDLSNKLHLELVDMVGEVDTNTLMSKVTSQSTSLESLMPLVGLSQVARGEMSREIYLERYGHRGPHELELFLPAESEDPSWLDHQLESLDQSHSKVKDMLAGQLEKYENTWKRFQANHYGKSKKIAKKLEALGRAARTREAVRSEITRVTRLVRKYLLRVGEVTGLGDNIFFLSFDEITDFLAGQGTSLTKIPKRRETYQRYTSLPPYPSVIIGSFDPFKWAADPHRRADFYDSRAIGGVSRTAIRGFAGAGGCVEGIVRRIDRVEDGYQILPGEILVTITTNVGWTPLFPRLAAIVTDVGAPLSHAAIVARELGIPAVVGCGNATDRLNTGDRVRVDGARGVIEILEPAQDGVS